MHAPAAELDGVEFYPELAMKAAVLCWHLVRNHPLPDGNKRCGFIAMLEFLERNGIPWPYRASEDEIVDVIEAVAAGTLGQEDLCEWLRSAADFPA